MCYPKGIQSSSPEWAYRDRLHPLKHTEPEHRPDGSAPPVTQPINLPEPLDKSNDGAPLVTQPIKFPEPQDGSNCVEPTVKFPDSLNGSNRDGPTVAPLPQANEGKKEKLMAMAKKIGVGVAVVGGVIVVGGILAVGLFAALSGGLAGDDDDDDKDMKAPGRDYRIRRKDFEGDPRGYFRELRASKKR